MLPSAIWQFFKKGQDLSETKTLSWRDQTLRFDLKPSGLALGKGEVLIGSSYHIEDIKGNSGQSGTLQVTNMRVIWIHNDKPKINISIGFGTVLNSFQRATKSALGETQQSICVLAQYASVKYEFLFKKFDFPPIVSNDDSTSVLANGNDPTNITSFYNTTSDDLTTTTTNTRKRYDESDTTQSIAPTSYAYRFSLNPSDLILKVWNAYKATISFRRCRINLTGLSYGNGDINLLTSEEIHDRFANVCYKTKNRLWLDGVLVLTNIRLIWMSNKNHNGNISIPYTQGGVKMISLVGAHQRCLIYNFDESYPYQFNSLLRSFHESYAISVESVTTDNNKGPPSYEIYLKVIYYSNLMSNCFTVCGIPFKYGKTHRRSVSKETTGEIVRQLNNYRALCKQISNLVHTYTETPRFGPELCDECKQLMQQFKMIKSNVNSSDTALLIYNTSAPDTVDDNSQDDVNDDTDSLNTTKRGYKTGGPAPDESRMFYHKGTCLAFEGKPGETDVETIWRMDG